MTEASTILHSETLALAHDCPWDKYVEGKISTLERTGSLIGDSTALLRGALESAGVTMGHTSENCPSTHDSGYPTTAWSNLVRTAV